MNVKHIILTIAFVLVSISGKAQCGIENTAFKSGEYLSYDLYFNWKFVWVKAVLDSFFKAKEQVKGNFQEIKASQDKIIKKRRPIGFNTDYTKDEIAK